MFRIQTLHNLITIQICLGFFLLFWIWPKILDLIVLISTTSGELKAVMLTLASLHLDLYPLFASANLQEQMSLLHTIWSGTILDFFFPKPLIVIHFGKASDVRSNKFTPHSLKKPQEFLPLLFLENFLLWTYIAAVTEGLHCVGWQRYWPARNELPLVMQPKHL